MRSTNEDGTTLITLPVFNILITITPDGGGGSITSDIHEDEVGREHSDEDISEADLFNAAMDGIESMILAHAIAGVDVESPAYLEGIETAVEGCANNF